MEFIGQYFADLTNNLLPGIRIEGMRYLIGTVGVFLVTWVFLKPILRNRLIRKRPPRKFLNRQVVREVKNSFVTILVFILAYTFVELSLHEIFGQSVFRK
ncbi:MAG: hypothetical protein AAGJ50_08385, partial [Pseudomonadota bacterium]